MGDEKAKVLSPGEIDFAMPLIAQDGDDERGRLNKIFLEDQKNLLMGQRLSNIWDAFQDKEWISVLDAIKEIPEHVSLRLLMMAKFPGKPYVAGIGWLSIVMLFKEAQGAHEHFSVEQVKSVNQFLYRIGQGLNREPWKTMFLKMAQEYFPEHIKEMAEALSETGIYEKEYLSAVWEHAVQVLNDDEALVEELDKNERFVQLVTYIDENIHNRSQIHAERFLEIADVLLARRRVYDACQVYKALKKEQGFPIGATREKIIGISDMYQSGNTLFNLSHDRMVRKVKRIIKKSEQEYIIIK